MAYLTSPSSTNRNPNNEAGVWKKKSGKTDCLASLGAIAGTSSELYSACRFSFFILRSPFSHSSLENHCSGYISWAVFQIRTIGRPLPVCDHRPVEGRPAHEALQSLASPNHC